MNLTHLKYIAEVEKKGSITKAAQNLYMGQPNLSKAIKELEEEMGFTVFKRTTKGVEPTQKGREFLEYAKKLLSQIDEIESIFKPNSDTLRLSITIPRATYCSVAFTRFLGSLNRDERMKIYFRESDAITAINDVAGGDSDIAVIRFQEMYKDYFMALLSEKGLDSKPLYNFEMRLLMSKNHPLAKYDDIPYHLLSEYTEVCNGDYDLKGISVSKIKRNTQIEAPAKSIYIFDRGSQLDMLQRVPDTFMWVSPIAPDFLEQHGLVLKSCSIASEINHDVIIYPKGHNFSKYEKSFVDYLKAEIALSGDKAEE
ncbi:MAG: LysR family transcriptional regulator [Ruminiclostridium sp.]